MPDASPDASNAPLAIVSSAPANNAKGASILQPISLFVNKKLDPATVNENTVKLRYSYSNGWYVLYGTVSYDDANLKISFVPGIPLQTGVWCEVIVDGVKSATGSETLSNGKVKFTSSVNYPTRGTSFQQTGKVYSYSEYVLDTSGRYTQSINHPSPGPDGLWYTSDDTVGCCKNTYTYDSEGRQTEYRYYGNAGPDGKYNTADDQLTNLQKYSYDAMTGQMSIIDLFGAGPDGLMGTADDVITAYQQYNYDANGFATGYYYLNSPGPDNQWHTADDRGQSNQTWGEWMPDARGNATKYIYRTLGTDGLPKTADDTVSSVSQYTYNEKGYMTRYQYYNGAGADGMWLTADDVIGGYQKVDLDSNGLPVRYWQYSSGSVPSGIGPDNMWFTADDVPNYFNTQTYNSMKLATEQVGFQGPGPDGVYNTADDVVGYYSTIGYETNGQRTFDRGYQSGPDGKYKTADDLISYQSDYDTTH